MIETIPGVSEQEQAMGVSEQEQAMGVSEQEQVVGVSEQEQVSDYLKYRGKCKELSEQLVAEDPTLRLVRGHYQCPIWGPQAHWWAERPDGTVIDPSAAQFPSRGIGEYVEFDNTIHCANCGREIAEDDAIIHGRYACCSTRCMCRLVGL